MKYFMTRSGADRLRAQTVILEAKLRAVLKEKGVAADVGGNVWHDNFAFEQASRDEAMLSKQLHDMRQLLRGATIVDPPIDPDRVVLGCKVEIEIDGAARKQVVVGGYLESDPDRGIVSYDSPLGKALLGSRPGDVRTYAVAGRDITVEIFSLAGSSRESD